MNETFQGVLLGFAFSAVLLFLTWLVRDRLGLARATVRWAPDRYIGNEYKLTLGEQKGTIKWETVVLEVPRGNEHIRGIKIYASTAISDWNSSPSIVGATVNNGESGGVLELPAMQSGRYVITLVRYGTHGAYISTQAVTADNAKVDRHYGFDHIITRTRPLQVIAFVSVWLNIMLLAAIAVLLYFGNKGAP